MAVRPENRHRHLERLLDAHPGVTDRAMFGMIAYFLDGTLFALADDERLYFKADAENEGEFENPEPWAYDDRPNGPYRILTRNEMGDKDRLARLIPGSVAAAQRKKATSKKSGRKRSG